MYRYHLQAWQKEGLTNVINNNNDDYFSDKAMFILISLCEVVDK